MCVSMCTYMYMQIVSVCQFNIIHVPFCCKLELIIVTESSD